MELPFTNRLNEIKELDSAQKNGGLLVVFGRRRVGKTRLLVHWLKAHRGLYSQAIEASLEQQLEQVHRDLEDRLKTTIKPKSWSEFFELLSLQNEPTTLCLDEFPYLVAGDPSLPSVLQRWLDHKMPSGFLLILAGSSTRMMNDIFLHRAAPLYGRARKLLHIEPMSYRAFCSACKQEATAMESFEGYALVGGIPKYWEFVSPQSSLLDLADELFFGFAPYLEEEPMRVLRDEGIVGANAIALLEVIGRGAVRTSEMAARLATVSTNLSRLLQKLLDASVLRRDLPFGESLRTTKKTLYQIQDPTLRFWFRVYSPHRTRWHGYTIAQKKKLVHDHASSVYEDFCRSQHAEASRYWEGDLEFDFVRPGNHPGEVVVSEVKWKHLSARERVGIEKSLNIAWAQCALSSKYPDVRFEVLDASALGKA